MKKKILITGINGFLGSHLAKHLKSLFEIIGLSSSLDNLFRIESENFKIYASSEVSIEKLFRENDFYAVVHVATVYNSKSGLISDLLKSNVLLPVNLLEHCNKYGVNMFLNTDSFFNNPAYLYSYLPNYTLSKKHSLDWIKSLSKTSATRVVNMKVFHMYGENDAISKFVPFLIERIKNNEAYLDLTLGEQTRDFVYVNDVVGAFEVVLLSFKKLHSYQEFEVGTGNMNSIKTLATIIKRLTNSKTELRFGVLEYRDGEIMKSVANSIELKKLGWVCNYNLSEGLQTYINN